jgi:hypothetical protein
MPSFVSVFSRYHSSFKNTNESPNQRLMKVYVNLQYKISNLFKAEIVCVSYLNISPAAFNRTGGLGKISVWRVNPGIIFIYLLLI